jgi:hypothetical protein
LKINGIVETNVTAAIGNSSYRTQMATFCVFFQDLGQRNRQCHGSLRYKKKAISVVPVTESFKKHANQEIIENNHCAWGSFVREHSTSNV